MSTRARASAPRRGARRNAARRLQALPEEDIQAVKAHWLALPLESRLTYLRITDGALVERAYRVQKALHDSELACYHRGIVSQLNEAGQVVVSTGLRHFVFEQTHEAHAEGIRDTIPSALCATLELVDRVDFFAYLEFRLGGFLSGGLPALRHHSLVATFDPAPNTWTEYEQQILRVVETILLQVWQDRVERITEQELQPSLADAQLEATILELEKDDNAVQAAGKSSGNRSDKKKTKRRAAAKPEAIKTIEKLDETAERTLDEEIETVVLDEKPDLAKLDDAGESVKCLPQPLLDDGGLPAVTHMRTVSGVSTSSGGQSSGNEDAFSAFADLDLAETECECEVGTGTLLFKNHQTWLSNGLVGDASRWSFFYRNGEDGTGAAETLASVKHTFLHVEELNRVETQERPRARSLDRFTYE